MDPLWPIEGIEEVRISPMGVFKYIVIQVFIGDQFLGYLIRGDSSLEYHRDNFKVFRSHLKKIGFDDVKLDKDTISAKKKSNGKQYRFVCPGGGRIELINGKKLSIYGYSKTYGHVDHSIAQKMLSKSLGIKLDEIKLN